MDAQPIAYWRMESSANALVANEIDGGTPLQVVGDAGIFAGGAAGSYAAFDGTTASMIAGQSAAFQFLNTDPFTIELWVRYRSVDPKVKAQVIFDGPSDGGNPTMDRYFIALDKTIDQFSFVRGAGATAITTTTASFADAQFHHVAIVYDGNALVGFVDGKPSTQKLSINNLTANSRTFAVGGIGSSFFRGDIDEVAVYDRVLSGNVLEAHANKKRP